MATNQTKRYKYTGPLSGATIQLDDGTAQEVVFCDGGEYTLPAQNQYVMDMVEMQRLVELPAVAAKPEKAKEA